MGIGGAVPFLALLRLVSFCGSRCEGLLAQLLRGLTGGTLDLRIITTLWYPIHIFSSFPLLLYFFPTRWAETASCSRAR